MLKNKYNLTYKPTSLMIQKESQKSLVRRVVFNLSTKFFDNFYGIICSCNNFLLQMLFQCSSIMMTLDKDNILCFKSFGKIKFLLRSNIHFFK